MTDLLQHQDGYFHHPSSLIDEGSEIGRDTKVWHWVHISSSAKIGSSCSLGQGVYVGNKVIIGDRVKIQNNVSVYDNVFLEEDVFCGPSMVFTNVYNPRSAVNRKEEYRDTLVRKGASLGANCTIICGVEIGRSAFVAAGAVVKEDVRAYELVAGVPAKHVGWMSEFGERLLFNGEGKAKCLQTHETYILKEGVVSKEQQ
jgi:UDP-2-acetamido-3-amino-2,3-dideoxy-glucuronate N-acetyltransferase